MKLYLLKPTQYGLRKNGPWDPWYDKCFGCVVRAANEQEARQLAETAHAVDGRRVWLTKSETSCAILTHAGEPGVVISNEARA